MASILVVSGPSQGDYYLLGKQTMVIGRDDMEKPPCRTLQISAPVAGS